MSKWIKFVEMAPPTERKTKLWGVLALDGTTLGHVSWYGAWRKYTFTPLEQTTYEQDCLRDIANFCETETKKYKLTWKAESGG